MIVYFFIIIIKLLIIADNANALLFDPFLEVDHSFSLFFTAYYESWLSSITFVTLLFSHVYFLDLRIFFYCVFPYFSGHSSLSRPDQYPLCNFPDYFLFIFSLWYALFFKLDILYQSEILYCMESVYYQINTT